MAACHRWPTSGRRGRFCDDPGSWVICSVRAGVHRGAARGPARGRGRSAYPARTSTHRSGWATVRSLDRGGRHDAGRSSKTRSKRTILRVRKGCPSGRQRTSRTPAAAAWLRRSSRSRAAPAPRNVAPRRSSTSVVSRQSRAPSSASSSRGRASRSPSSGTTVVRSVGARRLGRRLGRVVRRGAGAVVIRESVSAVGPATGDAEASPGDTKGTRGRSRGRTAREPATPRWVGQERPGGRAPGGATADVGPSCSRELWWAQRIFFTADRAAGRWWSCRGGRRPWSKGRGAGRRGPPGRRESSPDTPTRTAEAHLTAPKGGPGPGHWHGPLTRLRSRRDHGPEPVSYTHLRAHETVL